MAQLPLYIPTEEKEKLDKTLEKLERGGVYQNRNEFIRTAVQQRVIMLKGKIRKL